MLKLQRIRIILFSRNATIDQFSDFTFEPVGSETKIGYKHRERESGWDVFLYGEGSSGWTIPRWV
jgi:hypothetical protein